MTAPTVAVTIDLNSIGGQALAGVIVTAKLDQPDVHLGFIVTSEPVEAITNASGIAVMNLFPNALGPLGLGSTGSTYTFKAQGTRLIIENVQIPNSNCNLHDVALLNPLPPLDAANAAILQANAAVSRAQQWAENPEDTEVEAAQFSALHHSRKAEDFSQASAASAVAADTSADVADGAASAALASASAASGSAAAASASASAAAGSASVALAATTFVAESAGAVAQTWQNKARDLVVFDKDYSSALDYPAAMNLAYINQRIIGVRRGLAISLVCNPAVDDLQDMAKWISADHYTEEGADRILQIADGLANYSGYIDNQNGRFLDLRGSAAPDFITITSITFSNDGEIGGLAGEVYTATVGLASALPARVVTGYSVGGQNVKGDVTLNVDNASAEAMNGGFIVDTIAGDRLSFTTKLRSHGIALVNPTTLDGALTFGLTANQLVIPQACIRVDEAGWDGAAREGFINAIAGGRVHLTNIGITYNGLAGDNDILFASGAGSFIKMVDRVVIAGAGEMITRAARNGYIEANRACLGGSTMGTELFQGSEGGWASFTRVCGGSVSGTIITASSGCRVGVANSVLSGGNLGLRPTYANASIDAPGNRISHCSQAISGTDGRVQIDTTTVIRRCTTPVSELGSETFGNPLTALAFDGQTVNFVVGETVTGATSGATGVVVSQTDAGATGTLNLNNVTGLFQDNEALNGSLAGAAAAVVNLLPTGGIYNNTNAPAAGNLESANGYGWRQTKAPLLPRNPTVNTTIDFASIPANDCIDSAEVAFPGLQLKDSVLVTRTNGYVATKVNYTAACSSVGNFRIRATNFTAGAIDPVNTTFTVTRIRNP